MLNGLRGTENTEFITGTEFDVRFNTVKVSFSKVTNIKGKIEYDAFVEGGNNQCPIYLRKPKKQPDTIVFEKGIHTGCAGQLFALVRGGMEVVNVIILVKQNGKTSRILYFDSGLIVSKEISGVDAMGSSVLVERLEIAHSGLGEIPT